MTTPVTRDPALKDFIISRTFDAPRELVWKSLTEPERMQQWFAPKGFTSRAVKMEFRPGGTYHYCMSSPDGHEMWGKVAYREIAAPERLVYINAFSDAAGGLSRHPLSASWPLELLTIYTLSEADGKTTLTLTWTPENASEEEVATFESSHDGMRQGWIGTLNNLTEYLAQNR